MNYPIFMQRKKAIYVQHQMGKRNAYASLKTLVSTRGYESKQSPPFRWGVLLSAIAFPFGILVAKGCFGNMASKICRDERDGDISLDANVLASQSPISIYWNRRGQAGVFRF